jgi:diacylglycerol kinase (ATP)
VDPLLVLTNPDAGGADDGALDAALAVLRAGADVEVCATSNQGELDGVLHRRGHRRIVVAGGDGSLHAVVASLHRRHELQQAPLGLIPLGTGNDFARGAGIPLDPEDAARLVLNGEVRSLDLILDCVGEVVVNNVHVGVGARASRKSHTWKRRLGRAGYVVAGAIATVNPPFVRLRIEVDGEAVTEFDRPVLQVAIGNGPSVGGGTDLIPEADPEDGLMDVMISYAIGPVARLGYVLKLRSGSHHERDDVRYLRGSTVSVTGQSFYCSADGETYGPERRRTWHLEKAAFSMSLPG